MEAPRTEHKVNRYSVCSAASTGCQGGSPRWRQGFNVWIGYHHLPGVLEATRIAGTMRNRCVSTNPCESPPLVEQQSVIAIITTDVSFSISLVAPWIRQVGVAVAGSWRHR